MDMELAVTENSMPDFTPHTLVQNQGAAELYQQIGIGVNRQIMDGQFRDDEVENSVSNQYPPIVSQQLEENELDDEGKN